MKIDEMRSMVKDIYFQLESIVDEIEPDYEEFDKMRESYDFVAVNGGIDALKKRLMPEGMEWPKVDGEPVDFTTAYAPSLGVLEAVEIYNNGACTVMSHDGIVASVSDIHISKTDPIGADGLPIYGGDTVYHTIDGTEYKVNLVDDDKSGAWVWSPSGAFFFPFNELTHTKPEADSWEKLEKDAELTTCEYYGHWNCDCTGCPVRDCENCESEKGKDLMRRVKDLLNKENN